MGAIFVAAGNLDAAGVKDNIAVFNNLAALNEDLTIDMSAVAQLDGSGLGALVFLYKRLRSQGHNVSVINVAGQPLSLLRTLGIARVLIGKPSERALRSVPPMPPADAYSPAEAGRRAQRPAG